MLAVFGLPLTSCGGGSGSSGSGGGGGSGLSISELSPSVVMVGLPQGGATVYGTGFTPQAQVLIDGQPAPLTALQPDGTLTVELDLSLSATPGVHQFSVQDGTQVSNSVPYAVYAPQQGPFVMQAMPSFMVGVNERNPPFIAAADINGDGLADVVMPGPGFSNSAGIAILLGQADGTLLLAPQIPVALPPYALAIGDVDGNGTPDLVSITSDAGSSTTTVSILLGDGHGNFQAPVTQQTFAGTYPGPAYLVDLDGDGQLDLVLGLELPSGISSSVVWLKNTSGNLAAPVTLGSSWGRGFALGDFNVDGKPDIVYVAASTQTMHILLNQGGGKFKDQAVAGMNGVVGVANVIDFNLDGIPDLVVEVSNATQNQLYSFAGNGDGSFTQIAVLNTPPLTQLVSGDFDHDGFPDLAGPGPGEPFELVYFFGDGHGNFVIQAVVGPAGQYAVAGDFNGDGLPDIVVPDSASFVSLALGRADRNFSSPLAIHPATMNGVSAGDINGDGLPDIFVGGDFFNGIPGTVFLNQNGTSFSLAAYTDPYSSWVSDLTGKGVVDLLGGNQNLEIWPNNGTPDFSSSPITFPQQTADVEVADMDGDGHPDVISGTGQIFYGNGSYQFTPVALSNSGWGQYVVGDFNGDGKLDIATGGSGTFLNTGNRTFQQVTTTSVPLTNGVLAVVGDFNGDGKDDIAINLPGDSSIAIYYSNGDGTFYQTTVLDPGQEPSVMVVGDFDGDGRPDIAVGLVLSEQICILFNAGGGKFTRSFVASGAQTSAMVSSDLNRDGKPDLVIGNFVLDFVPPNVNVMFHK